MKNKKNIVRLFIILAIILFIIAFFLMKNGGKKQTAAPEAKKVEEIKVKEFDYELYDNKSDLYKQYFGKLKEELTKDQVNDDEYAKIVAQLFTCDFFSLADKKTNTDIGGLDFFYPDKKDNFILAAQDSYYKYVETNVYGDRKQDLPKVTAVEIKNFEKKPITIDKVTDGLGYSIVVTITYEKDMGFPKEKTLTLVHKDKKIYVAEIK